MSMFSSLQESLQSMSPPQLLLAFTVCAGYSLAQGALLQPRGQRIAWVACGAAALGFTLGSAEWANAVVLLAVAMAAIGAFVGAAWLISRALGLVEPDIAAWSRVDSNFIETAVGTTTGAMPFVADAVRTNGSRRGGHASTS